jgi:hypothetical protein
MRLSHVLCQSISRPTLFMPLRYFDMLIMIYVVYLIIMSLWCLVRRCFIFKILRAFIIRLMTINKHVYMQALYCQQIA